jgi:hypothetical protein
MKFELLFALIVIFSENKSWIKDMKNKFYKFWCVTAQVVEVQSVSYGHVNTALTMLEGLPFKQSLFEIKI